MEKKFEQLCEVILSKGLLNAYMKGGKLKGTCPNCGTMVPVYPGRYGKCPYCYTRFLNDPNPITNQEGGEVATVDDSEVDATNDPTYSKDDNPDTSVRIDNPDAVEDGDAVGAETKIKRR